MMHATFSPFNHEAFWGMPLVVILRGFRLDAVGPIVRSIGRGGLRALEITMNTAGAEDQIRAAVNAASGCGVQIGAGTVTSLDRLDQALQAGATFIVTPNLNQTVLSVCRERGVPVIPGAMTPTEVFRAIEMGALAAKIFPADTLGPAYIRALKAPMPHLKLAPTGGVTVERMRDYLRAGADAFGLGSPLFPKGAVESGDWERVEQAARAFHDTYLEERGRA